MKSTLIILSCLMTIFACKTKEYTPYDYDGEIIVFGGGGGFTGKVTSYTLMSNGQFFSGTHKEGKVYEYPRLEKKQVKQIFDSYHKLGFDDVDMYEGGNLYKFLYMYHGENEKLLKWGDNTSNPPKELMVYHSNLMALARLANKDSKDKKNDYQIR